MKRILGRLTYANVMATIAVFIALGGASYAAIKLPKNSVGAKQLKKGAVTPAKLSRSSAAALTGPAGPKGERGPKGDAGLRGEKGEPATVDWAVVEESGHLARFKGIASSQRVSEGFYEVAFSKQAISGCNWQATVSTPSSQSGVPRAVLGVTQKNGDPEALMIEAHSLAGAALNVPFHLAVFC